MQEATKSSARAPRGHSVTRDSSQPRVDIRDLVGPRGQITISHAGTDYTLRITRNGKLILTK